MCGFGAVSEGAASLTGETTSGVGEGKGMSTGELKANVTSKYSKRNTKNWNTRKLSSNNP